MSHSIEVTAQLSQLRRYRTPWQGEVVFACAKCQRRIRRRGGPKALRKVKKWFRKRAAQAPDAPAVAVVGIACVDLCPKDGVTIFGLPQLGRQPPGICIARKESDLEALYCELTEAVLLPEKVTAK